MIKIKKMKLFYRGVSYEKKILNPLLENPEAIALDVGIHQNGDRLFASSGMAIATF